MPFNTLANYGMLTFEVWTRDFIFFTDVMVNLCYTSKCALLIAVNALVVSLGAEFPQVLSKILSHHQLSDVMISTLPWARD